MIIIPIVLYSCPDHLFLDCLGLWLEVHWWCSTDVLQKIGASKGNDSLKAKIWPLPLDHLPLPRTYVFQWSASGIGEQMMRLVKQESLVLKGSRAVLDTSPEKWLHNQAITSGGWSRCQHSRTKSRSFASFSGHGNDEVALEEPTFHHRESNPTPSPPSLLLHRLQEPGQNTQTCGPRHCQRSLFGIRICYRLLCSRDEQYSSPPPVSTFQNWSTAISRSLCRNVLFKSPRWHQSVSIHVGRSHEDSEEGCSEIAGPELDCQSQTKHNVTAVPGCFFSSLSTASSVFLVQQPSRKLYRNILIHHISYAYINR